MSKRYYNKIQDERLEKMEQAVRGIKDNHLAHMQRTITKTSTDVDWLKRFFWIIATASVGGLVATVVNMLLTISGGKVV